MNTTEATAEVFLKSNFSRIVFEPDGNVTPDFLCDETTAVEVRLLNQNYKMQDGRTAGFESDALALANTLEEVYSQHKNSGHAESWYVSHQFRRPLAKKTKNSSFAKHCIEKFLDRPENGKTFWNDERTLAIEFNQQSSLDDRQFILAGWVDLDSDGFVESELIRNLEICVPEKAAKVCARKDKYQYWWLVLVDSIGHARTNPNFPETSAYHSASLMFDRIFLLHYDGKTNVSLK